MTTLTAPDDLRTPTATFSGGGRLRVQRAGSAEKVYPLGAGKWTIGSSARCHIQLPATESRPIQCLVALDGVAATATRWAAGVLLNGSEFAKQDLRQGDRLSIGAWELQWEIDDFACGGPFAGVDDASEFGLQIPQVLPVAPAIQSPAGCVPATKSPEVVAEVDPSPPAAARRPAAKTVLVSSRTTDPFVDLLRPQSTSVVQAAAPTDAPAASPPHASLAFEDRLVLDLWAAKYAARTRAKALASRAREARDRIGQLTAAAEVLESRIAAARSASDAHAAEQRSQIETLGEQLQRAIVERDTVAAELERLRTAPPDPRLQTLADACSAAEGESQRLGEQLAASEQAIVAMQSQIADAESARATADARAVDQESQIASLGEQLQRATVERDSIAAELESLQTAPPDPRLQTLADACSAAESDSQRLGEQLAAREQTIVALQSQIADAEDARATDDARAADQESRIASLGEQLQRASVERDSVAAELETLRTAPPDPRLQTLADACSAAESESQRLGEQLGAHEQTIVALKSQIAEAETTRARVDAHSAEQDSRIKALSAQLSSAVAERDDVAAELEALRTAPPMPAPPDPRLQTLADACAAADVEKERLREQLAASEQQLVALQTRIADAEVVRAEDDVRTSDQESQIEELGEQLRRALVERDSVAAELETLRTAPPDPRLPAVADACAAAESESLRLGELLDASEQQIGALRAQLAATETACRNAEGQSAASTKLQAQWQAERDALENDRRQIAEEVARLNDEVRASELHIERLEEQAAAAAAARAAVEQQLADQQRQQAQWLAECRTLQDNHAEELAEIAAERDDLQRRLVEQSQAPALAENVWPSAVDETAVDGRHDAVAESPLSLANAWGDAPADPAEPPAANIAVATTPIEPAFDPEIDHANADNAEELSPAPPSLTHSAPAPAPAESPAPEKPFTPTSFIDKYRHLLEDENAPEPSLRQSRPILDDEYLSPSKFPDAPSSTREDESDEALEAYMSNLMRRVRTPGATASTLDLGMSRDDKYVGPTASQELERAESTAAAMPVETDANGMVRTVRKQPAAAANLSALRELANNSARTAIAQHRQRRHAESTVTKGLTFAAAAIAATYLMLTAPGVDSPWFWGGCAALVAACGAAAKLISQLWNRLADVRLQKQAAPKAPVALELPAAIDEEPVT